MLAVTLAEQGMEALDFNASRAAATSPELGQYRMIHVATECSTANSQSCLDLCCSLVDEQGRAVNCATTGVIVFE
jgi:hypothetical protein